MEGELHKIHALSEFSKDDVISERFKIVRLLGRGGMGSVYEIEHLTLNTRYAMKILSKGHTNDASWRRFEIEARATNKLEHPNLIKVHDFGLLPEGQPFFIMDLVEGETLTDALKRQGRLSVDQAVKLFIQVGFALSYAHSSGIVHRDVKPGNIILTKGSSDKTEDSLVKLVDFGIAKLTGQDGFNQQTLTRTGEIFGSPLYMSPEQCMGVAVDHRSDLYSLGCVLFEALTGAPPLVGDSALSTMMKHQSEAPLTLKEASMGIEFPRRIEQIVERLLEKDPSNRYQSAELFTADLVGFDTNHLSTVTLSPLPIKKSKDALVIGKPALIVSALGFYFLGLGIGLIIPKPEPEKVKKLDPSFTNVIPPVTAMKMSLSGADASRAPVEEPIEYASTKTTYFSQPGPGKSRTFNFPDFNIGDYCQGSLERTAPPWVVPNFRGIYFKPSMEFKNHPKLFRRFRPDDIISLNLSNNRTFTNLVADNLSNLDAMLPHVVHIKSITSFSGADSRLSAKGIQFLDQLPNLLDLRLERTELVGKELARLRTLPKLYALGLYSVRDVKPILHKLRGSGAMRTLLLVNCHLDSQQVNLLSTTKLEQLDIENNPDVTDSCVDHLPASLERLSLVGCNVTGKSAEKLGRLKHLRIIFVDKKLWTKDDVTRARALLPRTTFVIKQDKKSII